MKITHLCLAAFYCEGYTYQENLLPRYHKAMGFDVDVIASLQSFDEKGMLCIMKNTEDYVNEWGIHVVRLYYKRPYRINRILRKYVGLYEALEQSSPDVIFIHGVQSSANRVIAQYLSKHPNVAAYADSHADYFNSATNPISFSLLHKRIWRHYVKTIDCRIIKYWGVSPEACDFLQVMYGLDSHRIGLLPLGADDANMPDRFACRQKVREAFNISDDEILFVTGGKLDKGKGVLEIQNAFSQIKNQRVKLLIFGRVAPEINAQFHESLTDQMIFAGWIPGDKVNELLLAADCGIFPGTQSVIWMQAVVCGLPCIFRKWPKGNPVDLGNNCVFVNKTNAKEIGDAINSVLSVGTLSLMKKAALSDERLQFGYSRIAGKAIGFE